MKAESRGTLDADYTVSSAACKIKEEKWIKEGFES